MTIKLQQIIVFPLKSVLLQIHDFETILICVRSSKNKKCFFMEICNLKPAMMELNLKQKYTYTLSYWVHKYIVRLIGLQSVSYQRNVAILNLY